MSPRDTQPYEPPDIIIARENEEHDRFMALARRAGAAVVLALFLIPAPVAGESFSPCEVRAAWHPAAPGALLVIEGSWTVADPRIPALGVVSSVAGASAVGVTAYPTRRLRRGPRPTLVLFATLLPVIFTGGPTDVLLTVNADGCTATALVQP